MLLDEMRSLDQQNEKQIEEIRELKGTIKNYEYEVEAIAEEQHKDTEEFIRNLQKNRVSFDRNSYRTSFRTHTEPEENGTCFFKFGKITIVGKFKNDRFKRTEHSPSFVRVTEEEEFQPSNTEKNFPSKSPKDDQTTEKNTIISKSNFL